MPSLYGKLAIITGSARGFGEGFAECVLNEGGKVTICDVLEKEGKATAERFEKKYGKEKVFWAKCDVTSESDWVNVWDSTEKHFGQSVDILVNNAGVNHKFGWKKCMDIDIMGVMIGTELAQERFAKANKKDPHIINIASVAGLAPSLTADAVSYFVAKAGVVSLSKSLGCKPVYGRDHSTRVDCICPIFADTAIVTQFSDVSDVAKKYMGGELMPVSHVVDAFKTLATTEGSGRVLVCLKDTPFIHWPNQANRLLEWLALGAMAAKKIMPGTKEFTPALQVIWLLLTLFAVFFVFKLFAAAIL